MQRHDTLSIDDIRTRTTDVLRRYDVQRAILFGSFARGEASRHSDVDLLLVKETDERFLDRARGLLEELAARLPLYDVDVLVYTPAELRTLRDRPFFRSVLSEGIVLYEPEQTTA